jgi:uncharacterized protein Yka (UPF0111/DUF47 family)
LLDQMMRGYPEEAELAREILICEPNRDRITHDISRRLNEASVTPIDRQDTYDRLEDAVDATEAVAHILENIVIKNS